MTESRSSSRCEACVYISSNLLAFTQQTLTALCQLQVWVLWCTDLTNGVGCTVCCLQTCVSTSCYLKVRKCASICSCMLSVQTDDDRFLYRQAIRVLPCYALHPQPVYTTKSVGRQPAWERSGVVWECQICVETHLLSSISAGAAVFVTRDWHTGVRHRVGIYPHWANWQTDGRRRPRKYQQGVRGPFLEQTFWFVKTEKAQVLNNNISNGCFPCVYLKIKYWYCVLYISWRRQTKQMNSVGRVITGN